jgi:tRNA-2-methylthio-N6-dimethylallyladenosine synthase
VLAAMNRRYTAADYCRLVDKLHACIPGVALTTDVLVGFPGEMDDDFAATLRLIGTVGFDFLYAFKYSPRPGTAAAALADDVPRAVKESRHARVLEALNGISTIKNATLVGTVQEVLVEGARDGKLEGRTRTNKRVFFPGPKEWTGHPVNVRITGAGQNSLTGIPAEQQVTDHA